MQTSLQVRFIAPPAKNIPKKPWYTVCLKILKKYALKITVCRTPKYFNVHLNIFLSTTFNF